MVPDIGTLTYGLAAVLLAALAIFQISKWNTGISSLVFVTATVTSLVWSTSVALQGALPLGLFFIIPLLDSIRYLVWFVLLLSTLGLRYLFHWRSAAQRNVAGLAKITIATLAIPLALIGYLLSMSLFGGKIVFFPSLGGKSVLFGFLLLAIAGIALLEQIIRNTRFHHRWHIKYLCLGLGICFSFDIFLYSEALLFDRVNSTYWQVRGAVVALSVPFLMLGVSRTSQQPIQLNISRQVVFHTGVLVASGIYLLLMAGAGYYIRDYSGQWGPLLQAMFWVTSLSLLLVLLYSDRFRSSLRGYISRNLFSVKYDYRQEWMRFTDTLSQPSSDEALPYRVISALANIVDSPAGGLWLTTNGAHFNQVAQLEMGWIDGDDLTSEDALIRYLAETFSIVNMEEPLDKLKKEELPEWLIGIKNIWLIVPLELQGNLVGFVLLKQPRIDFDFNWEDRELLSAAGQQAASYLAQMVAADALSESREFAAFNQGTAFVVHDLKTLSSQLSLLVSNAAKHKENPEFIDDMIKTTAHAVKKMDFLLAHFRGKAEGGKIGEGEFNLIELVEQIVSSQSRISPQPVLSCNETSLPVVAAREELLAGIKHIVQNAQEATDDRGKVELDLRRLGSRAVLVIKDTGVGMSQEFIKTRLFKPFDSSKGVVGMGIGVFQSREALRNLGGELKVKSKTGVGTEFTLTIPLLSSESRESAV